MWREYFKFEVIYRRGQPLFWITGTALFLAGLVLVSTDLGVLIATGNASIHRNAPLVLIDSQIFLSLLGMFVLAAFVADSVLRDFNLRTSMFFFSKPAHKGHYLAGRFLGSTFMTLVLFLAPIAGFIIGHFAPWQDASRLGSMPWSAMIYGFLVFAAPNLITLGAFFFTASILSRRILVVYIMAVTVVFMQDGLEMAAEGLNNLFLSSVLEPLGLMAVKEATRYWAISEFNNNLPELSLGMVMNRTLWCSLGIMALLLGFKKFQTTTPTTRSKVKKQKKSEEPCSVPATPIVAARLVHGLSGSMSRLLNRIHLETFIVFKSVPFLVLLFTSILFVLLIGHVGGMFRGTASLPVTSGMVAALSHVVKVTLPVIIMIYSGQLIWRDPRTATIENVMPVPNWVYIVSKIFTLLGIVIITITCNALALMCLQIARGYTNLEPLLYLKGSLIAAYPMWLFAIAAIFLHTLASSKNMGHLLVILLLMSGFILPKFGVDHTLFLYAQMPPMVYSVFNGYGHFTQPFILYCVYWGLSAGFIFLLTNLTWRRNTESGLGKKIHQAVMSFNGLTRIIALLLLAGFIATGWRINQDSKGNLSKNEIRDNLANYERKYSIYRDMPAPQITNVFLEADLFPRQRKAVFKGRYSVKNTSEKEINRLPVTMSPRFEEGLSAVEGGVQLISMGGLKKVISDEKLGFYMFELNEPLAPNVTMVLTFEVAVDQSAYRNRIVNHQIVTNGTHFLDHSFLPFLGYHPDNELRKPSDRKAEGLGPKTAYPQIEDPGVRNFNYLMADWVGLEAIISTVPDQIVVGQGDLVEEREKDGRRFFHYRTQAPVTRLLSFISGSFEVERKNVGEVAVEIYYHPKHHFNIERMMTVAEATLQYAEKAYAPYPHNQLRIVEVPKYDRGLAISLGGLITISEDAGFYSAKGDIDQVSYYTSHEIAHQWWNHQVISARAQGACMIAESLSQYTSLAVLEKQYGKKAVKDFLTHDEESYFKGRKRESRTDRPLIQVENQSYIHYDKANLVFHALKDVMGEEELNSILSQFLNDFRFQGPPYPTATDLAHRIASALPDERQYMMEDLFETITLYDNRLIQAQVKPLENGRFEVNLDVETRRLKLDGSGAETVAPPIGFLEIGCFGEGREEPFKIRTVPITKPKMQIKFEVDQAPSLIELDPLLKMMDRNRKDNRKETGRENDA